MNENIIELRGLCKSFYGVQVLKNINMHIKVGEALCIAGENGSGKSTIIKTISGVHPFESGEVVINGNVYKSLTPSQSIDEGIQVIYQDFALFPNLTVAENIGLSYHLQQKKKGFDKKKCAEIAKKSLEKIGVQMNLETPVENLTVAQKQIVAIARAIMQEAKLIIMDEPTTTLTKIEIENLYKIINGLKSSGIAIIFVSHKLDEIFAVCDRVFVIRNGEVAADYPVDEFEQEKLTYYMTGTNILEETLAPVESDSEYVFEVKNLACRDFFKNISFGVRKGEILCLTGRLGSGRLELAKSLFGALPTTGGEIFLNGEKILVRNISEAIGNGIAYVPEDRLSEGVFLETTIRDNLCAVILKRLRNKFGILKDSEKEKLSKDWIDKLSIKGKSADLAHSLSGGNQQRVVLAKWMASNPSVFVFNCPTVGVDVKSKFEIHTLIKEMVNQGVAIIIVSDDIGEILYNTHRVLVMNDGEITFEADARDLSYDQLSQVITKGV